jgi:hypothetical protein
MGCGKSIPENSVAQPQKRPPSDIDHDLQKIKSQGSTTEPDIPPHPSHDIVESTTPLDQNNEEARKNAAGIIANRMASSLQSKKSKALKEEEVNRSFNFLILLILHARGMF